MRSSAGADDDDSDLQLPLAGGWRSVCFPLLCNVLCPLEGMSLPVLFLNQMPGACLQLGFGCLACRMPLLQCT